MNINGLSIKNVGSNGLDSKSMEGSCQLLCECEVLSQYLLVCQLVSSFSVAQVAYCYVINYNFACCFVWV
jgi:hypothetical protein